MTVNVSMMLTESVTGVSSSIACAAAATRLNAKTIAKMRLDSRLRGNDGAMRLDSRLRGNDGAHARITSRPALS